MRRLTNPEITTVLNEANLQLFRRSLRTYIRIEHPLVGGLEYDTSDFLNIADQTSQDLVTNKLSAFLVDWLQTHDVEPL